MVYPEAVGTFTFRDRNNLVHNDMFAVHLKNEFIDLDGLALTDEECEWAIKNIPYIPRHYWEWLKTFRFDHNKINVWLDEEKHLHIEVTDVIYKVTMYEIPILAIVSEVYYKYYAIGLSNIDYQVSEPLRKKMSLAMNNGYKFSEFGMRRRFSHNVEDKVCEILSKECPNCAGTSTVYFAKKYGMKPIGTMAHELFMATAALTSPKEANYIVMENWSKVYDGDLGTVLTDTYTVDAFMRAFSMKLAKLYDGVRHDSGDPIEFGEKIIAKYKSYGIDPMSKFIIFSDSLDFNKCVELNEYFKGRIKVSFGIGTNLTNDLYDVDTGARLKPLNIVMKLKDFQVNPRQPKYGCVKLSDVPSKAIGTEGDIANYKYQLGITE
jgi:nicotinate phosphoribosyltransferase